MLPGLTTKRRLLMIRLGRIGLLAEELLGLACVRIEDVGCRVDFRVPKGSM